MSFAQLTFRESLRDIESCLHAISHKLYHCGVKSKIAKSTLADANESRDWRIYADTEIEQYLVFLTNNFTYVSEIIAQLYKERWRIELFFKWIKQHLRIKKFYGTSFNAVCTQIWIAVSIYLLVAIIKKRLKLKQELYTILQIFSISLFEKVPLNEFITKKDYTITDSNNYNQLKLFDL